MLAFGICIICIVTAFVWGYCQGVWDTAEYDDEI
jgi:hypothetical protein